MKPLADCRLYAFVDTAYLRGRPPQDVAQELCDGGADLIQLRAKNSPPDAVLRMAEAILPVAGNAGVGLVINDYPSVALAVGAPACHLGQEDFFGPGRERVSELRPPGSRLLVGLSTREPGQAGRALRAQADYLGVGPVYATGTKPEAKPVTLSYVRWAAAEISIPWFAIGGIHLENVDEVLAAGARGICVVSAILNAADIAAACRRFREKLDNG
jgi:thiamine-phosphate pyrophosphorylase